MKRTLKAMLTLAIISPLISAPVFAGDKGIYGRDDRRDVFDASPEERRLADSVASLWPSKYVRENDRTWNYTLITTNFGDGLDLCPGEKFIGQPSGSGLCSGSLVGGDLIMTAGHCVKDQANCDAVKIVFGFAIKDPGAGAPTRIDADNVYSCKKIVTRAKVIDGPDYALIQLDRPVSGRKPLEINRGRSVKKGDKVMVIGHPASLPLKIAGGATVRNVSPRGYFVTDLDTFGGNSGSPVFNAATGLIEGILVRGDEDFNMPDQGCTTMAVYPQNGGRGEVATKVAVLESFIP